MSWATTEVPAIASEPVRISASTPCESQARLPVVEKVASSTATETETSRSAPERTPALRVRPPEEGVAVAPRMLNVSVARSVQLLASRWSSVTASSRPSTVMVPAAMR